MTTPIEPRASAVAALIVYGRVGGVGLPQASWFKAEDSAAAKVAAEQLKLSVLELKSDEAKALTAGVHEGVLKSSGRAIIGSVTPDVHKRIEDYARKGASAAEEVKSSAAPADPAPQAKLAEPTTGSAPLETARTSTAGPSAASPAPDQSQTSIPANPWDALRVGSTVLAAYWDKHNEIDGWWPAVITRADKNEFVLRWRDTNEYPPVKLEPKHVAILHPEFLASLK